MKHEFITADGKLVVENGKLRIRRLKDSFSYEHYRYLAWLFFAVAIISQNRDSKPLAYIIVGIMSVILLGMLINFFYMNQWKSSFSIRRIREYKLEHDPYGLESTVTLYFASSTAKKIVFRTSENQHQAFINVLNQELSPAQFA